MWFLTVICSGPDLQEVLSQPFLSALRLRILGSQGQLPGNFALNIHVSFWSLSLFFQVRPSPSQDARTVPANVLQGTLDERDDPDRARPRMLPSTSTPNPYVRQPNISRGGPTGMTTRSAARYLSTCHYLSLYLIISFFSSLVHSNLI